MADVTSPRGGSFHIADGRGASGGAWLRVNRAPSVASATTEFSPRCWLPLLLRCVSHPRHLASWSRCTRSHVVNLRKCNRQTKRVTGSLVRSCNTVRNRAPFIRRCEREEESHVRCACNLLRLPRFFHVYPLTWYHAVLRGVTFGRSRVNVESSREDIFHP